ncbi:MAG: Nif3-like dinuclear metal center hexameric protein [Planctomycetota bacterium]
MSASLNSICQSLSAIAPLELAESWDNVGLLVGDRQQSIERVMTCLTISPTVVEEAIDRSADLIVAHHPLPFRPLKRINSDTLTGQMLWRLIGHGVAVYSAHTAFDSASLGINQRWAESLGLRDIRPMVDAENEDELGSGRVGVLAEPQPARELIRRCLTLGSGQIENLRGVGPLDKVCTKVGFACGSGGTFVAAAHRRGCSLLVTGEATFHQCLEAESLGMALGLLGHYHSERFAMEWFAERLAEDWPELSVWPSECERDPIQPIR